jgi:periplasmic protein TonB
MPMYSLREIGTVLRDFPAATTVAGERAGCTASVATFSARPPCPRAMTTAALDSSDRVPPSTTAVSRPRWPAWTAAIALHLAAVATVLYSAELLLAPAESSKVKIALVLEPPASPSTDATTVDRSEVVSTRTSIPPVTPSEPSPPVVEAIERPPIPPPPATEAAEPPATERPSAPPNDRAPPPPRPTAKPTLDPRPTTLKPAPTVARNALVVPRPQEQPTGATGEAQRDAPPPQTVAAIPAPMVRSTPVGNLYRNRKPDYPAEARRRGLQGRTLLRVEVSAAGTALVVQIVASSGYPVLDQAALAAVREWRFDPATLDGKPVSGAVELPVRFRLDD